MALPTTTQEALLLWLLGEPFPAPPQELWLALHHGPQPTLVNEIHGWAGGDRLRVSRADFHAPAAGGGGSELRNSRALMLGMTNTAQAVESFGLWSAAVDGTLLLPGAVPPGTVIAAGDPPVFLTGDLALQVV